MAYLESGETVVMRPGRRVAVPAGIYAAFFVVGLYEYFRLKNLLGLVIVVLALVGFLFEVALVRYVVTDRRVLRMLGPMVTKAVGMPNVADVETQKGNKVVVRTRSGKTFVLPGLKDPDAVRDAIKKRKPSPPATPAGAPPTSTSS